MARVGGVVVGAHEALRGSTAEVLVNVTVRTWRFRLGLWLLGIALRLMGASGFELKHPE